MRRYLRMLGLALLGLPLYTEVEVGRVLRRIEKETVDCRLVDRALHDVDQGFDAGAVDEYLHDHIERVRKRLTALDEASLSASLWWEYLDQTREGS